MIQNIIANPTIYQATQSTITQVATETCLKAIGRPAFILADKKIDDNTKKYSSTKEFLYQLTCLGIYLSLIIPVFKKGAFNIARKIYPNEPFLKVFKNPKDYIEYSKLDTISKENHLINLKSNKWNYRSADINEDFAKGIIEGSNILGSVLGLAIIAPVISHPLIHPILKKIGLAKNDTNKE